MIKSDDYVPIIQFDSDVKVLRANRDYLKSLILGALSGLALALVFGAGFFVRDIIDMPSAFALQDEGSAEVPGYPLVDEVQDLLDSHYLREQPDYSERQYAAIRGILGLLDRNTFFIDPPVARSESQVLAGTYGGIGVSIQRNAAGQFMLYPFPDGPAAEAGIQDGDMLVSVNSSPVDTTMQQDAVDQLLRGEVKDDNGVDVTVRRLNGDEFSTFIPFEVINIPSVLWRVLAEDERMGYVQVLRFTSRTPDELIEAVKALQQENILGMVLDLRNNSGGLLQESIDVASIFLDGGVVVYEQTRNNERVFEAESGGQATELPLVVLVNRGTASASELVAGAIRDRYRGVLIGQTTYGKGTIQQIFTLSDSSSVHITSAEWFTPARHALDGVGLEPDIAMIPDENGRDIEIGEAILYLQQQIAEESR